MIESDKLFIFNKRKSTQGVDETALEMRHTGNRIVSSNLTSSAPTKPNNHEHAIIQIAKMV